MKLFQVRKGQFVFYKNELHKVYSVKAITIRDPKNYHEAMKDPRVKHWKEAMRTEIDALEQNHTWEVIRKPREAKLLHRKWVYKLKMHADGTIERTVVLPVRFVPMTGERAPKPGK